MTGRSDEGDQEDGAASRRGLLGVGVLATAGALAGGLLSGRTGRVEAQSQKEQDAEILNFVLDLERLQARSTPTRLSAGS